MAQIIPRFIVQDASCISGAVLSALRRKTAVIRIQDCVFMVPVYVTQNRIGEGAGHPQHFVGMHAVVDQVAQQDAGSDIRVLGGAVKDRLEGGSVAVDVGEKK